MGEVGAVTFFVLKVPYYESAMLIYFYLYILRAFGGAPLAHLEARLWRSITINNFAARFARRAFGTPKDNGVDASIGIFLVASLEYHLI